MLAALLNYHYGNIGMDYTLKRYVPQQIDPSWSNLAWDLLTAIANQASALINPNKVLAEREGFEPPIPVKVWPLSRRLVSTTHAPLRINGNRIVGSPARSSAGDKIQAAFSV